MTLKKRIPYSLSINGKLVCRFCKEPLSSLNSGKTFTKCQNGCSDKYVAYEQGEYDFDKKGKEKSKNNLRYLVYSKNSKRLTIPVEYFDKELRYKVRGGM
jgi:hypothetical protein